MTYNPTDCHKGTLIAPAPGPRSIIRNATHPPESRHTNEKGPSLSGRPFHTWS